MNIIHFKTDNVYLEIKYHPKGLTSDVEKDELSNKVLIYYKAEDFSGNVYEREINLDSLEDLSPLFRMDPLLYQGFITLKPKTYLQKDVVVCMYEFIIFGRNQTLEVLVNLKVYPSVMIRNANIEPLELKKTIQSLKMEVNMLKHVVRKNFTHSFFKDYAGYNHLAVFPFSKGKFTTIDMEAIDYLKMPCTDENGSTFYHQAFEQGWYIEKIEPHLINIDAKDPEGSTVLHRLDILTVGYKNIYKRLDLATKLVQIGANCNILNNYKHTALWALCSKRNEEIMNEEPPISKIREDRREKFLNLLTLMLDNGADPNIGFYSESDERSLLQVVTTMRCTGRFKWNKVIDILKRYGAR